MTGRKSTLDLAASDVVDAADMLEDACDMQRDAIHRIENARFHVHLAHRRGAHMPSALWAALIDADDAMAYARRAVDDAMDAIQRAAIYTHRARVGANRLAVQTESRCGTLSVSYYLHVALQFRLARCGACGDTCVPAGQYIETPATMLTDGDRCAMIEGRCA